MRALVSAVASAGNSLRARAPLFQLTHSRFQSIQLFAGLQQHRALHFEFLAGHQIQLGQAGLQRGLLSGRGATLVKAIVKADAEQTRSASAQRGVLSCSARVYNLSHDAEGRKLAGIDAESDALSISTVVAHPYPIEMMFMRSDCSGNSQLPQASASGNYTLRWGFHVKTIHVDGSMEAPSLGRSLCGSRDPVDRQECS